MIIETDCNLNKKEIETAIKRLGGDVIADIKILKQDIHLSKNQKKR